MTEVKINSGTCGFETIVRAEAKSDYQASLEIKSSCQHVQKMAEKLDNVNAMGELFKKGESKVLSASQDLPHITCPVTVGILKALEASAGLALPKDVSITFQDKK